MPASPADDWATWVRLTEAQKKEKLRLYEAAEAPYDFRGKEVAWRLRTVAVKQQGDDYVLTARASSRTMVGVLLDSSYRETLRGLAEGDEIVLCGTIREHGPYGPQIDHEWVRDKKRVKLVLGERGEYGVIVEAKSVSRSGDCTTQPTNPGGVLYVGDQGIAADNVVLVVDTSGSMVRAFDQARLIVLDLLDQLGPKQRFNLVILEGGTEKNGIPPGKAKPLWSAPQEADAKALKEARETMSGIRAMGEIRLASRELLKPAFASFGSSSGSKAFFWLTDGDLRDTDSTPAIVQIVKSLNVKVGAAVYPIMIHYRSIEDFEKYENRMKEVAEANDGKAIIVPERIDLPK